MVRHPVVQARLTYLRDQTDANRAAAMMRVEMPRREQVLANLIRIDLDAEKQGNLAARLKANELLGKELGMFVTRIDAMVSSPLDGLSRDQLLALANVFRPGGLTIEGDSVLALADDVSRETGVDEDDPLA
jgi:hypothetical protein